MVKKIDWQSLISVGDTFGRLTVVSLAENESRSFFCKCECGQNRTVLGKSLLSGNTKSCGCSRIKHGHSGGVRRSMAPEYSVWQDMNRRCHSSSNRSFSSYGARGISVCDRWRNSFSSFYSDMGPRPTSSHSLDRINNDIGYSPENCRWATGKEQSRNTRRTRLLTVNGLTMSLSEWAERNGGGLISTTISQRLKCGWPPELAVKEPKGTKLRLCKK